MESNQNNRRVEAFTPGPWCYSRLNWRNEVDDHKRFVSGENERGFYVGVCVVEGNRTSQCVTAANARLIACAPSLYAIVRAEYDAHNGFETLPLGYDARRAAAIVAAVRAVEGGRQ